MKYSEVCVIGAGYVGLTFAVKIAQEGLSVQALDINKKKIDDLNSGFSSIPEKNLNVQIKKLLNKKIFFNYTKKIVANDIIIAISYFPNKPLTYLKIFNLIEFKNKPTIYIRGTVPVGFIKNTIQKYLKKKKLKVDKDYFIVSAPERTLSGDALNELSNLTQLVGASTASFKRANKFFKKINTKIIHLGSTEAGELAKVFCNFSRLSLFNISNYFMSVCSQLKLNEKKIIAGIKKNYPRLDFLADPGPGVGGFCLPKDSLVLSDSFHKTKEYYLKQYPRSQYDLNRKIIINNIKLCEKYFNKNDKILILGIAFKGFPETDDFRDSFGLISYRYLSKKYKIFTFDKNIDYKILKKNKLNPITFSEINKFKKIIIANNNQFYSKILKKKNKLKFLYDPWRSITNPKQKIFHLN